MAESGNASESEVGGDLSPRKPVSFLYPLTQIDSNVVQKRLLKLLAVQEVDTAEIAFMEYQQGILNGAHSLHVWLLHRLKQCCDEITTKEEEAAVMQETDRVIKIIRKIEESIQNLEKESDQDEDGRFDFLTLPMSLFISRFTEYKNGKQNAVFNAKNTVNDENLGSKTSCDRPGKKESSSEQFKPAIRQLVKHSLTELPTWSDIVGYEEIKQAISQEYVLPRQGKSVSHKRLKRSPLLFGAPGNGKTLFCEALSSALNYRVLQISNCEFASSFIGENLHKLKACFEVAIECAPCVLFFDEIETMAPERTKTHADHKKEEVNQFIVQLNLLKDHNKIHPDREVIFVSATNLPEEIDVAIRRRMVVRLHVPLPSDFDRRLMMEKMLGLPVTSVLNEIDWKTLTLLTAGYSSSDVQELCSDILNIPERISMNSEYFRPLWSKKLRVVPSASNSPIHLQFENEIIATHWTPCSKNHPEARKKSYMDIAEDVLHCPFTVRHIVACAKSRPPSLDIFDEKGPVKLCEKFAETSGNKSFDFHVEMDEGPFDSNASYQEAKVLHSKFMERATDDASENCAVSQSEVKRVARHKGKWVPIERIYEVEEQASISSMQFK